MRRQGINIVVIVALLLLPALSEGVYAQGRFSSYFNSDSFWQSIEVVDKDALLVGKADTQVMLVSNRVFDYKQLKFAQEESGADGSLHYFLAFVRQGKWYIKSYSSLAVLFCQMDKGKSLVVYTEGYGKNFTAGLFRALAMRAQYGVNVLYLDYPSINSSKKRLGNWRFVLKEAHKAGADFTPVLDSLYQYQLKEHYFSKVTLFYHSMGNLALKHMLQNGLYAGFNDHIWVDNLVLNAACVPVKDYIKWLGKAKFARHILVHYNPEDRTLLGAQLVSGNRKIGLRPGKKVPANTVCVNFNGLVGNGHNYFLTLPYRAPMEKQVANYMQDVLHGEVINIQDTLVFRRLDGQAHYELTD
ncbi:MAG: alpha/beta hydrolase [Sphingobacteriales bacterium]|nr:MAG: alpha/beta hydrolase [Sphingobacteriales bacterium]